MNSFILSGFCFISQNVTTQICSLSMILYIILNRLFSSINLYSPSSSAKAGSKEP